MSTELNARTLFVTVTFDPQASPHFTYSGDINEQQQIVVDVKRAFIRFSLETKGGGVERARFLDELPLEWMQGPTPDGISVWLPMPGKPQTEILVEDLNPLAVTTDLVQELPFRINVLYGSKIHTSSDPAIINVDIPPIDGKVGRHHLELPVF